MATTANADNLTDRISAYFGRRRRLSLSLLIGPVWLWTLLFIVLPCGLMILISFWRVENQEMVRELSLKNYNTIFSRYVYYATVLKSIRIALISTAVSVIVALPIAYVLSFKVGRLKHYIFPLLVISLWVGYLLRAFSWRLTLGDNGILNGLLMATGITERPLDLLLYSPVAVILALTNLAVPFALIPIYTAFEQIPRPLMDAASDLGAGSVSRFFLVTAPMALHGIVLGACFAFILSFGDYLAPVLVGGPSGMMVSNLASSQFGASFQWPMGSAIAVVMFAVVVVFMGLAQGLQHLILLWLRRPFASGAAAPEARNG
jgi:spermidine/putrescine transport system permease protein